MTPVAVIEDSIIAKSGVADRISRTEALRIVRHAYDPLNFRRIYHNETWWTDANNA